MSKFDPKDSITKLREYQEKLIKLHEKIFTQKEITKCISYISKIETYLLNDNKDDSFLIFDAFCETNIINEYNYLVSLKIKEITFSILKSLSVLILSITKIQILYLFYSTPLINKIILSDFKDDDYLSYQINFMKSLCLKLNKDTINFFYNEDTNCFPLVEKTFDLRTNSDGMIRNVVRNIILTLLKIDDQKVYNYFTSYPIILYFANLVLSLKPLMLQLTTYNGKYYVTKDVHDDILDSLLFIQDILSLNLQKINKLLINCLLSQIVIPFANIIISSKTQSIPKPHAINYLLLIFYLMKDKEVIDIIAYLLFVDKISNNIDTLVKNTEFNASLIDFNIILSFDKLQDINKTTYDNEIKRFLLKYCGYSCSETKQMNDPNSSSITNIIELDLCDNGEIKLVTNDIYWNIIYLFKQKKKDDKILLMIFLLIHTAQQKKDIDPKIKTKSLILYDHNINSNNNNIVMLDYEPEEDNENSHKKQMYFLDLLLSMLVVDNTFSSITIKLYYELLFNEINKNSKLHEQIKETIAETYQAIIGVIQIKLSEIAEFGLVGYELFTNAYNEYNSITKKKYESMIMEPWLLIPLSNLSDIHNYPFCLYYDSSKHSIFSQCLITFMSLYDLQAKISKRNLINTEFPIPFEEKELEIGQKMKSIDMPYEFSDCKVKKDDSLIKAKLIFRGNNAYFAEITSKETEFIILAKIPTRRIRVNFDLNDNSIIILQDKQLTFKKTNSENVYSLIFKSIPYAASICQYITQKKNEICETEYIILSSYFESAESLFL